VDKLTGQPGNEQEQLDLVRYWRAIRRNLWRILALVAAVGILAQMYASGPPIYRATATILVEASKPKIVSIEEVYSSMAGAREFYQTQFEILRSRELTAKLVQRLKLAEHPALDPRVQPPAFYEKWLPKGFLGGRDAAPPSPEAIERSVIGRVQGGIAPQLVRNSQLIRISYDSTDAELAAAVPNALAEIYIEADLDARMQMNRKASSFLTVQTAELKKKVTQAEQALQAFRERERIIDVKTSSQAGASSQVEALTTSLIDARRRRNEAEYAWQQVAALGQVKKGPCSSTPTCAGRRSAACWAAPAAAWLGSRNWWRAKRRPSAASTRWRRATSFRCCRRGASRPTRWSCSPRTPSPPCWKSWPRPSR
jgi:uncharacterized protein involved in exopolysaccharide biosynthesis